MSMLPLPAGRFPSVDWLPSQTQELTSYSDHTYGTGEGAGQRTASDRGESEETGMMGAAPSATFTDVTIQ